MLTSSLERSSRASHRGEVLCPGPLEALASGGEASGIQVTERVLSLDVSVSRR